MPAGPGVRVDTAIEPGGRVPPEYDNLIAKLMVHAGDRNAAIVRLGRALDETEVGGIQTTVPFHRFVTTEPDFLAGRRSTGYVAEHWDGAAAHDRAARGAQLAAALDALEPTSGAGDGRNAAAIRSAGPVSGGIGSGPSLVPGTAPAGRATTARPGQGSAWRRAGRAAGRDRWPT
jgi:acetyl/propionyl-CoA carboxylase alpha subunit